MQQVEEIIVNKSSLLEICLLKKIANISPSLRLLQDSL